MEVMHSQKRYGVGIIGTGFGAHVLIPAFRKDSRCVVRAVAASNEEKAHVVAKTLGVPHYFGDWKELIRLKEVDIVAIAVPPVFQPEMIDYAVKHGKAVFAEKPIAGDLTTAQKLLRHSSHPILVDYLFAQIATWKKTKQLLSEGRIGKLVRVSLIWHLETYTEKITLLNWKTDPKANGGALNSFGSHVFYNLEWFAGKIRSLQTNSYADKGRAEHAFEMDLVFESGVTGQVSVSTRDLKGVGHRLEFFGTNGILVLENGPEDYVTGFSLSLHQEGRCRVLLEEEPKSIDGRILPANENVMALLDHLEGEPARYPNLTEAFRVEELLNEANNADNRYFDPRVQRRGKYLLDT